MTNLKKLPVIGWLLSPGFPQGATWAVLTCLVSASNDVVTRFVGFRLHTLEISFLRFFFTLITILPFMLPKGLEAFKTQNPKLHFWRGVWGVIAFSLFVFSLSKLPLAEVTTFTFTQPLWFMPLALVFLREKINSDRWIAAIIGFVGIVLMVAPGTDSFNFYALFPIAAAFCFGCLDVLAKKMVSKETTMTMLFYFALATTVAGFIPALYVWETPTIQELLLLFVLGAGGNLIQVCLFCAFRATQASSLAPFRYVELVFAITFGFLLFNEVPTLHTMIGAAVIIASTLYLSYREAKRG